MPDRRCCACIFPRRSVRCLPGSARTAVGGRRDGCPGPSNSPSSDHRQRTGSRRSAPSIPTGHKKVFPIPGGHKKSVLFQGRFPAVWTGLEPATPCVTGRYSNQLNYHTVLICECKSTNFFRFSKLFTIFSADDLLPQLSSAVLELPHLSGTARGAIVRYFPELQHRGATAENTATCYAQAIETFIRHTPR